MTVEATISGTEKPGADMAAMREHLHALADVCWRRAYREGIKPDAYTATLRIEKSDPAPATRRSSHLSASVRG